MKKISFLIIALFAVLYTAFWFYNAHHIKTSAIDRLKELEYTKIDGEEWHVADVAVTGFPFSYDLNLIHPKIVLSQGKDQQPLTLSVDGSLKVGTDVLGRSLWIKQDGDIHVNLPSGKEEKKFIVKGNGKFKIDVLNPNLINGFLNPYSNLRNTLEQDEPPFQELLAEIKGISYSDSDFSFSQIIDNSITPLISLDHWDMEFSHRPLEKDNEEYFFSFNMKDVLSSDKLKNYLYDLHDLIHSKENELFLPDALFKSSGKNNTSLTFTMKIPRNFDPNKFLTYNDISFDLKKWDADSDFGHFDMKGIITLDKIGESDHKIHVDLDSNYQMTPEYNKLIQEMFVANLKYKAAQITEENDPAKSLATAIQTYYDHGNNVLPDYSQLGLMQMNIDVDAFLSTTTNGEEPKLQKLIVRRFNGLTTPFGIKSEGDVQFVNDLAQGKYAFTLINYNTMIHDAVSYFNRLQPAINKYAELNGSEIFVKPINEKQEMAIAKFLKVISDQPDSQDETITTTIDFRDLSNITIGGHTLDKVFHAFDPVAQAMLEEYQSQ